LAEQNIDCYVTDAVAPESDGHLPREVREEIRQKIVASYIGVTGADFCMADTATLVMRNRAGQPRSVAVVPSIHIAVIAQKQIISDLKELYALLRWDPDAGKEGLTNYMAFISGPSKTADIEATLVHGAHGPREVHVYVIAARD
jgi:L-lactate dehydrogenase complex protein LldG